MAGRRAQPTTLRSRLGFIRLLLALDIIVLGLVLYDAPVFKVSRIRVNGTQALAPTEVVRAAAVEGENLLSLDRARKEQAIRRLHWVKAVVVERRLPNELVIRVTERRPAAAWITRTGRYLVDDEGVVLGESGAGEPPVTVADVDAEVLTPGQRLQMGVVAQAEQLRQLLPQIGVVPREFLYAGATGMTVVTEAGWKARFGGPDSVAYKVAVLRDLVPIASRQRFELIDVQSPDRPYIR